MPDLRTRQIIQRSTACPSVDTASILEKSRHNNAIDGITGILWFGGRTFVQVLEGPSLSVVETFGRIERDHRHEAVTLLSNRHLEDREFGYWSMEERSLNGAEDDELAKVKRRLVNMPEGLQNHFLDATQYRRSRRTVGPVAENR